MQDQFYILKLLGLTQNWKTGKYKCTFIYLLRIFNCHIFFFFFFFFYWIQAHFAYCKSIQLTVSLSVEARNIDFIQKASRQRR